MGDMNKEGWWGRFFEDFKGGDITSTVSGIQ